jgi:enamine deaminase RidA (YjgF/YER057c/UK114 family)
MKRRVGFPGWILLLLCSAVTSVNGRAAEYIRFDEIPDTAAVIVDETEPLVHTTQFFPNAINAKFHAEQVLFQIWVALGQVGRPNVVKLNVYLANAESMKDVGKVIARRFASPSSMQPAVSFVVGDLAVPGAQVAMDAVSVQTPRDNLTIRNALPNMRGVSPVAVLPPGPRVYVSGMADTNNLPVATRKTLEKLLAAIGHLGCSKEDIVQLKAFLQPMSEVEVVREEIVRFFESNAPPTVFVEWISPPPNPPIEIELIVAGKGDFSKETESVTFLTPPGTTDSKVFRRVARVNHGKLIYISGIYGMKASDGAGQVREIFGSLGEILKKTGSDFDHLAKATYYVADDQASKALNDIRPEFYNPLRAPSASKAKVKGVGVANKTITMDMIAVTK